jgi:hypothetical protein
MAGAEIRSPFLTVLPEAPAIFLPAALVTDSLAARDDTLRAVLAHEVAHLKRRDCQWNLLLRLTCALCWPQPLLWRFSHRMEQVSEEACDEYASRQLASPHDYADCLVTLAQRYPPTRIERAVGTAVLASRSSLEERIKQLMNRSSSSLPPLSPSSRVVLSAGSALVVMGSVLLVGGSLTPPLRAEKPIQTPTHQIPVAELVKEKKLPKKFIDLSVTNAPAREILDKLLAGTGMTYRFDKSISSPEDVLNAPISMDMRAAPLAQTLYQFLLGLPGHLTYAVEGNEIIFRTEASTMNERGVPTERVTVRLTNEGLWSALNRLFVRSGGDFYLPKDADGTVAIDLQDVEFEVALNAILKCANRPMTYEANAGKVTIFYKNVPARPLDAVARDIPKVPVSGDFDRVPLREAIQQIFKQTTLQYSLTQHAYGTVNVRLKDVPLDAALRKILAQSNPPLRASLGRRGRIEIKLADAPGS